MPRPMKDTTRYQGSGIVLPTVWRRVTALGTNLGHAARWVVQATHCETLARELHVDPGQPVDTKSILLVNDWGATSQRMHAGLMCQHMAPGVARVLRGASGFTHVEAQFGLRGTASLERWW